LTNFIAQDGALLVTSPHRNSVCAQHQMLKGLQKVLYVRPTTCADCFHFSAEPARYGDEVFPAGCGNDYEVIISEASQTFRPVEAGDQACEEHTTDREVEIENEKYQEGIEREAAEADAARKSEGSAERITMQVLNKLRKGGAQ
jgi:hypothetical protein